MTVRGWPPFAFPPVGPFWVAIYMPSAPMRIISRGAGKAMVETRVYKRRRPERTDYYRIIESRFEELEGFWPECFEQKYGYLRKEVMRAIYAFLDCGIPENGVARVFCDGCGRDYFVAFSCRTFRSPFPHLSAKEGPCDFAHPRHFSGRSISGKIFLLDPCRSS